jgi:hypothetical protein
MCVEIKQSCECGKCEASFHLRDNIMVKEVVDRLYCPACSGSVTFNNDTMLRDNEWVIEYDMDLAGMLAISKMGTNPADINPEYLFDEGLATWREMYPGETLDIADERWEIIKKKDKDPKAYLQEINSWAVNRIRQMKDAGWRKARFA